MSFHESTLLRERPVGELVKDLSRQISTLVHQEVELAKAEMAEKGKKAGLGAALLAAAGVGGLLALGALTAFLIAALAEGMAVWVAALIVTALWAAVAAVLGWAGKRKVDEVGAPVPEKTVESVKEDVRWLKGQTS